MKRHCLDLGTGPVLAHLDIERLEIMDDIKANQRPAGFASDAPSGLGELNVR